MQNIIEKINKDVLLKVGKVILFIIVIPFVGYIANLILLTIFNLGYGTGNFIRNLYKIIC